MYRTQCVWALLALSVGLAHSFSWDIVLGRAYRLEFYHHGILTWTAEPVKSISWISYDPVRNRVLVGENYDSNGVYSFDIATKTSHYLMKPKSYGHLFYATYDPVTDLLYCIQSHNIYSFSLKPAKLSTRWPLPSDLISQVNGNLVLNLEKETTYTGLAVDSCKGYVYWMTYSDSRAIERVRFDGSSRELLIVSSDTNITRREGLIIDQQTHKMYWIGKKANNYDEISIESADLDGKNRKTIYSVIKPDVIQGDILTVSNDLVYWADDHERMYWQLPKNPANNTDMKPKNHSIPESARVYQHILHDTGSLGIEANYKIEDQTRDIKNCNALKSLIPNHSVINNSESLGASTDVSLLCVHGTKVSGESRCKCTQGYTGERCDVSVCQNYCFHGNCSASVGGQPKCRCNVGYSGERCEVDACHKHCLNNGVCSLSEESEPFCQCTGHYEGERCGVSVCQNYCFRGDCSVAYDGQPKCRCNGGFSGERCQINACHGYCSNSGVCSLNNDSEPVCQCTGRYYTGERCDIPVICLKSFRSISMLKKILNADVTPVTLHKGMKSTAPCASTVV